MVDESALNCFPVSIPHFVYLETVSQSDLFTLQKLHLYQIVY